MKTIHLDHISKNYNQYGKDIHIIKDFSYIFRTGEIVGIFGSNGSGKTTLLHLISGLEKVNTGSIEYIPNTKISYMFQDYRNSLFPWMTVEENIGYPLQLEGYHQNDIKEKISKIIEICKINIDLKAYPYMLSGGKQQLTNIMRSIINKPDFLLLDEPFASLDYATKEDLYMTLQKIFLETNLGIIIVSHDVNELIRLSNKILLLDNRPLHTTKDFTYNEPYPRQREIEYTTSYSMKKKDILEYIY